MNQEPTGKTAPTTNESQNSASQDTLGTNHPVTDLVDTALEQAAAHQHTGDTFISGLDDAAAKDHASVKVADDITDHGDKQDEKEQSAKVVERAADELVETDDIATDGVAISSEAQQQIHYTPAEPSTLLTDIFASAGEEAGKGLFNRISNWFWGGALVAGAVEAYANLNDDSAQESSQKKIAAYAADNSNSAPTVDDYANIGVTGVNANNLAAVNSAVDGRTGADGIKGNADDAGDVDAASKVQDLVTALIASQGKVAAYAADNSNSAPTVDDYANIGVTGVNADNLAAVNSAVDGKTGADGVKGNADDAGDVDSASKVQGLVSALIASQGKIAAYAADNSSPAPTADDYANIGVTGVNAGNVAAVNNVVDHQTGADAVKGNADDAGDVDTAPKVQDLVDLLVASQATIEAYAADNSSPAPTVDDYANIGVTGVNADNLAAVNSAVDGKTGADGVTGNADDAEDVDTASKVQDLVNALIDSQAKIEAYAADNSNPVPTVDDYANIGVTGVNAGNVAVVNSALDHQTGADGVTGNADDAEDVDAASKVQDLVDGYLAILAAADGTDGNGVNPSQTSYADIGVTGVDDPEEVALLGDVIDGLASSGVDSVPKVQVLADAVQSVMDGAAGVANTPTLADLQLLGITGVTATNLPSVVQAIAATANDGSGVDSQVELQTIVDNLNRVLSTTPTVDTAQHNTLTPTITGTATLQAGEDLSVTVHGATYDNVTLTNGTWSINTGSATPNTFTTLGTFVDGQSYEVVATVRDAAGNAVSDSTNNEVVIDTTVPTAPTVTATQHNTLTPTISGTATLQAGEDLSVTVNGATYDNVAVSNGAWTINTGTATPRTGTTLGIFVDGQSYSVVATVRDAAGNSASDSTNNEVVIDATAPTVASVAVANGNYGIGDQAAVTITAANAETGLTLSSATFNGQALSNVTDNGDGTYTGTYAVQAGDADVAASGSVVTNLAFSDGVANTGSALTSVTLSANTSIDANAPSVAGVTVANGNYGIGDQAAVTITAANAETGLTLSSATFNGQALSNVTDNGDGTYTGTYAVQAGDADVAASGSVVTNLAFSDGVANTGSALTSVTFSANTSIDANAPSVAGVTVSNGSYAIGDQAAVTITAANAETGLTLSSATFNGQALSNVTDNGDGTYTGTYAVQAGDADVAASGSVVTNLAFSDGVANTGSALTSVTLSANTSIDTTAPTAPTVTTTQYNTTLPTITGTATLLTGEALSVTVNGATYDNVTVSNGAWSLDTSQVTPSSGTLGVFVDGQSYSVIATARDAAGNTASDSTNNEVVIDTTAPVIGSVLTSGSLDAGTQIVTTRDADAYHTALGDIDGDGDLDLITSAQNSGFTVFKNDGSGAFGSGTALNNLGNTGRRSLHTSMGDIDGDGDLDLITSSYDTSSVFVVYENDGSGNFNSGTAIQTTFDHDGAHTSIGDIDGDGDLDLVAGVSAHTTYVAFKNDGQGNFDTGTQIASPQIWAAVNSSLGDFDGDGDLDLITVNYGTGAFYLYKNDGQGNFGSAYTTIQNSLTSGARDTTLGDIDGDGDLDLITSAANSSHAFAVYKNDGQGNFGSPTQINANVGGSSLSNDARHTTLGDIDGDGDLDLVTSAAGSDAFVVFENDGTGTFGPGTQLDTTLDDGAVHVTLGDLDGDGGLDLIATAFDSDAFVVFKDGGIRQAGDEMTVTITEANNETGLTLTSTTFNGQALTNVIDNGNGTYSGTYTVQPGDPIVAAGGTVNVSLVLTDAAGNNSVAFTTVTLPADTSIAPPIVLDLGGDGINYTSLAASKAAYDFDGDGQSERTAWVSGDDALLGYDANGDGLISGREELVLADYLQGAQTDLEGLRAFDSNGNGLFDDADAKWQDFLVWQDVNGDGVSTAEELRTLDEVGIASLSLSSDGNRQSLASGSVIEHGQFTFTYTDGSTGVGADAAFSYRDSADATEYMGSLGSGAVL